MKRSITLIAAAFAVSGTALPSWSATDQYRSRQWGLDRIHAGQAWSGSKGAGVTIAIVDTGIDLTHPDLKGKIAAAYACIDDVCKPGGDDDHGHGSHVAGIAAATTGNGVGIAGVAPAAKLMAVKALDADGSGACSDIELAIRWAADHGARVVNLSLGPDIFSSPLSLFCIGGLQDAAAYAWSKGAVVVIAAGNDSLFSFYSTDELLVVGATQSDDDAASYSNAGANIYAPGGDSGSSSCSFSLCVFSTWKDGGYRAAEGTSMAAPHVSGVAALLLAKGYTNAQVLSRILSTADDIDGILRVNAARAVGAAAGTKTVKPKPSSGSGSGSSTAPRRSSSPTGTPRATATAKPGTPIASAPAPPTAGTESGSPQASGRSPVPTSSSRTLGIGLAATFVFLIGAGIVTHRVRTRRGV